MKNAHLNLSCILIVLLAMAMLTSCSSHAPKESKYIPKDVSSVLVLDPQNLQDKLEKSGINIDTLINRLFQKNAVDSEGRSEFYSIKADAGINWNSKIFFFSKQHAGQSSDNGISLSLMTGINSASKLESFLKKQKFLREKSVVKEKEYAYLLLNNESLIAWNETVVIGCNYKSEIKPVYDTVAMKFIVPDKTNPEKELIKEVNQFFTQKESESLASVEAFGNMFKTKSDGYAFSSSNNYLSTLSALPLQLPKMEDLLKDNYFAATLSFEEGKVVATGTTYTNPFVSSILKKYAGPTVNLSLIEKYPSNNINMILMASFNPEIFGALLKQLEVEGLVNSFMDKLGFSSQDLYKALKGDIAFIVSDLQMPSKDVKVKNDSTLTLERKPFGKMILNAPIGDAKAFTKIMDKAVEMGYFNKSGNIYGTGKAMEYLGIYIRADNSNFIIASDSVTYAQYMSKQTASTIKSEALNLFKGKTSVAYFDIANTIQGFLKNENGNFKNSMLLAKETFKDVLATTDNFDGNALKGKFEVRLNNEKQNSIITLAGLFTDIAADMRMASKKESGMESNMFPSGMPAIIRTN